MLDDLLAPDPMVARRAAAHAFRSRRTVPAVLTALALVAFGVLILRCPVPTVRWRDPVVPFGAAGAMLAGALLLAGAVRPGRRRVLPLSGDDPSCPAGVADQGVRRMIHATVLTVPGIDTARVRLRSRLTVRAFTGYRNPSNLREQVHAAAAGRIADLDPIRSPPLTVRLSWRDD